MTLRRGEWATVDLGPAEAASSPVQALDIDGARRIAVPWRSGIIIADRRDINSLLVT